ncbi:hypothetical protein EMPG_11020, partial [Blastomyces silverae]
ISHNICCSTVLQLYKKTSTLHLSLSKSSVSEISEISVNDEMKKMNEKDIETQSEDS